MIDSAMLHRLLVQSGLEHDFPMDAKLLELSRVIYAAGVEAGLADFHRDLRISAAARMESTIEQVSANIHTARK